MFDFSNLFCCNPNCPRRCNDVQSGNGNGRPNRPPVIVGPRGPRGYTGATGPQGEAGSIASSSAILTSTEPTSETLTPLITVEADAVIPLSVEKSDEGNVVTLNGDGTFTLTEAGSYLAIFTVQLNTSATATAGTISINLTDNDGVIYGNQTTTDSDRTKPIVGVGFIGSGVTAKTYGVKNASGRQIDLSPLSSGDAIIRQSLEVALIKLTN